MRTPPFDTTCNTIWRNYILRTISTFDFSKRELMCRPISMSSLLLAFKNSAEPAANLCLMPTLDTETFVEVGNDVCFVRWSSFAEVGLI